MTQILLPLLNTRLGRHVKKAAYPPGAVQNETSGIRSGAGPIELQQVVDDRRQMSHVVEEIQDHGLNRGRHERIIDRRDRLDDDLVHLLVEDKHATIEALQRIRSLWGCTAHQARQKH